MNCRKHNTTFHQGLPGLEIFFLDLLVLWGKWSKFSLVLTQVELVLKSGILKSDKTHNSVTYLQLVLGDI